MDSKKLKRIVYLTILFQIPIHVVTARADIPGDRKVVEGIIDSINGFHSGPGGFKREHIHFASTKEGGVWKQVLTKTEIIERIQHTLYPHLSREAFLFVEDMTKYLEDVMKAGFLTYQANPKTKEHFDLIEEFILSQGQFYTHRPMLFKQVIASIPPARDELPCQISQEFIEDGIKTLRKIL